MSDKPSGTFEKWLADCREARPSRRIKRYAGSTIKELRRYRTLRHRELGRRDIDGVIETVERARDGFVRFLELPTEPEPVLRRRPGFRSLPGSPARAREDEWRARHRECTADLHKACRALFDRMEWLHDNVPLDGSFKKPWTALLCLAVSFPAPEIANLVAADMRVQGGGAQAIPFLAQASVQWHLLGRWQQEAAQAQPTTNGPPHSLDFTIAALRDLTGLGNKTLGQYAKGAGVKTPQRGQRNFRYSKADVQAILRKIIETTGEAATRKRCQEAVTNLQQIAK